MVEHEHEIPFILVPEFTSKCSRCKKSVGKKCYFLQPINFEFKEYGTSPVREVLTNVELTLCTDCYPDVYSFALGAKDAGT